MDLLISLRAWKSSSDDVRGVNYRNTFCKITFYNKKVRTDSLIILRVRKKFVRVEFEGQTIEVLFAK